MLLKYILEISTDSDKFSYDALNKFAAKYCFIPYLNIVVFFSLKFVFQENSKFCVVYLQ